MSTLAQETRPFVAFTRKCGCLALAAPTPWLMTTPCVHTPPFHVLEEGAD